MLLPREIWKDIRGYEGKYQVSNIGNVRSLNYRGVKGKVKRLKTECNNCGYILVFLYKECKPKGYSVHRLVAEAFIPNPNNLPQVNHKDENKANNCVWNLEWCTREYNRNYGTCPQRVSDGNKGKTISEEHRRKISEVQKGNTNCIGRVLSEETKRKIGEGNKRPKSHKGKPKSEEHRRKLSEAKKRKIRCIETGDVFNSILEASNTYNINKACIQACCKKKYKTAGGYQWEY